MESSSQPLETLARAKAFWVRYSLRIRDEEPSNASIVDQNLARNCTTISPCQQDSTIIRDSEITQNIVNSCGRTEIAGNIDVGEQTENELAANRMTQVSAGSVMTVTIHQVSNTSSLTSYDN